MSPKFFIFCHQHLCRRISFINLTFNENFSECIKTPPPSVYLEVSVTLSFTYKSSPSDPYTIRILVPLIDSISFLFREAWTKVKNKPFYYRWSELKNLCWIEIENWFFWFNKNISIFNINWKQTYFFATNIFLCSNKIEDFLWLQTLTN